MASTTYSSCSESSACVKWVKKYFKDCVCDLSSEVSFGLGLVSLVCWGVAEIPQIITNFQTKSGHGVSLALLLTWVLGDIFNLVGCLLEPVTLPTQFYTALLYTATTVVLLFQTIYYDHCIRWWKNGAFETTEQDMEEIKPLNPKKDDDSSKPISTNLSVATSPRVDAQDVHYTSARSLTNSGSSPYARGSYLQIGSAYRGGRSGPSNVGAALHDSSSEEEEDNQTQRGCTNPKPVASRSIGYGTFIIGSANLPFQAKAMMEVQLALHGTNMLQEITFWDFDAQSYGIMLGWIMAAIYMGGRLPQIYLNIKRGNVEGLNPLMFIFALIANAAYVGSILGRSVEWDRLKANAPWLLDAIVCVLLDLFIIFQFAYYKFNLRRRSIHEDEHEEYTEVRKPLV